MAIDDLPLAGVTVTSQLPPMSDALGHESARSLPPELVEQVRAAARDLPTVLHLVRPGLPAPADRAIRRLVRAQRRFGLTVHASAVTGAVPDVSGIVKIVDADGGTPVLGPPIVHLHADLGDHLASELIGSGTLLQSVYSPTGRLHDHPDQVPLVVATDGVAADCAGNSSGCM